MEEEKLYNVMTKASKWLLEAVDRFVENNASPKKAINIIVISMGVQTLFRLRGLDQEAKSHQWFRGHGQ